MHDIDKYTRQLKPEYQERLNKMTLNRKLKTIIFGGVIFPQKRSIVETSPPPEYCNDEIGLEDQVFKPQNN